MDGKEQPPPYPGQQGPGGYPPPQGGYPPPQGGYPPPQGGYPPPQGGYPPPQGGYPHPQGGYPPPQGGYPPPQGGYYPPPQSVQQTSTSNVVVVSQAAPTNTVIVQRQGVNHLLHFIITLFFWPWVIVWIILCITEGA